MTSYNDVQAFVRAVREASDVDAIGSLLADATREFGFDHYGLTHVDRTGTRPAPAYLTNFPQGWLSRVSDPEVYVHDPVLLASERSAAPFAWSELSQILSNLTDHQRRYMELAEEEGLSHGYTVPLHIPGEASGVCSFVTATGRDLPREALPAVYYLSAFAFEALRRKLMAEPGAAPEGALPKLTQRQTDCVLLVAQGKSAWVAGKLLGISPETVRMHLDMAKRRFGVASQTQLVVRALYYGQLSFTDVMRH